MSLMKELLDMQDHLREIFDYTNKLGINKDDMNILLSRAMKEHMTQYEIIKHLEIMLSGGGGFNG